MALAVLAATILAPPGLAQDAPEPATAEVSQDQAESAPEAAETTPEAAEPPAAAGEAAGERAAGGPVVLDEEEGSVLDDQTFEGEDDDFIPSEQIPIDQPIPFPTDI